MMKLLSVLSPRSYFSSGCAPLSAVLDGHMGYSNAANVWKCVGWNSWFLFMELPKPWGELCDNWGKKATYCIYINIYVRVCKNVSEYLVFVAVFIMIWHHLWQARSLTYILINSYLFIAISLFGYKRSNSFMMYHLKSGEKSLSFSQVWSRLKHLDVFFQIFLFSPPNFKLKNKQ